ncbi:MAG TPA: porin [Thermodesulfobacteriota bacterium]|nr:porin [Thermodesulfobacteriota bacterium]
MARLKVYLFVAAILVAGMVASPNLCWPQDLDMERLEGEVEELKKKNEELERRMENMEADEEEDKYNLGILAGMVKISGYADAELRLTDSEDENSGFRARHLSLFFNADVQPSWRLFSEIEYEDTPFIESAHTTDNADTIQGKIFVEQMYIEYHPSVNWDLRFGRYLTPAGIWSIYHYPPYVPTQTRPLMIRNIFPQVADGAQLRFSHPIGGSLLDTHLYAANGAGNPGRLDRNESKAFGARVNYSMDLLDHFDVGASYYRDKDNDDVTGNSYGAHLLVNYKDLELQSEFATRYNDPEGAPGYTDTGFYAQLAYDIGKWTLAGRFDWFDDESIAAADKGSFRYTGAVNYHFAHNVVAKAEYNRNEFGDSGIKDYNEVVFATVINIGDL